MAPWNKNERMEYTVLGRIIGTATGWDQSSDWAINFYDFEPAPGIPLMATQGLVFDSETGLFEGWDEEGNVVYSQDAVATLLAIPRKDKSNG